MKNKRKAISFLCDITTTHYFQVNFRDGRRSGIWEIPEKHLEAFKRFHYLWMTHTFNFITERDDPAFKLNFPNITVGRRMSFEEVYECYKVLYKKLLKHNVIPEMMPGDVIVMCNTKDAIESCSN